MIGGPYRTNPPFTVSISMKVPWDPMTLVWSSTDTKRGTINLPFDSDRDFFYDVVHQLLLLLFF